MLNAPRSMTKSPSNNYYNSDLNMPNGMGNRIVNGIPIDSSTELSSDIRSKLPFAAQSKQTIRKNPKRQLNEAMDEMHNGNEEDDGYLYDDSYDGYDDFNNKMQDGRFGLGDNSNAESLPILNSRLAHDLNSARSNLKYNNYKISLPQSIQLPDYQTFQNMKPGAMGTPNNQKLNYRNEVSIY